MLERMRVQVFIVGLTLPAAVVSKYRCRYHDNHMLIGRVSKTHHAEKTYRREKAYTNEDFKKMPKRETAVARQRTLD